LTIAFTAYRCCSVKLCTHYRYAARGVNADPNPIASHFQHDQSGVIANTNLLAGFPA
jgi:hypothetical protein